MPGGQSTRIRMSTNIYVIHGLAGQVWWCERFGWSVLSTEFICNYTLVIVTLRCHDVVFITGDFIKRISVDFRI